MASERRKRWIVLAVSTLATLLLAEVALRLVGVGAIRRGSPWFAGGNHPRFLFQPAPASGYALRPGFQGREIAPQGEFDVPVSIDARGLRDHGHTRPPHPCLLTLGDSMTFGEGVPAYRAWPALLEKGSGYRTYNAGVPGYGTPQMAGRFRSLSHLRPSLVLVAFSPRWDRERCAAPFLYKDGYIVARGYLGRLHTIDGNLYLAETRLPVLGGATAYVKRYSAVARLALPALGDGARAIRKKLMGEPERPLTAADYEITARALERIRDEAGQIGADFLAILLDSRDEQDVGDRGALETILRARQVPYVALDALLQDADWKVLRYPRDQHWNEAGHRAVAAALTPIVRPLVKP